MSAKTFIVTGASKGIGLAIAQRLLSQGHNVVLTARSQDLLAKVKADAKGGKVEYIAGDITEPALSKKLVDVAVQTFGGLDGLVLNHGLLETKKWSDTSLETFKKMYDVNVFSYIATAQASIEQLRKSKGAIVSVSSGAGVKCYGGWSAYGSAKAAINSIAGHIAVEEPDVTSVAIQPGRVDTDMQQDIRANAKGIMDNAVYQSFIDVHEQGELLKPEQPGNVIANFVAQPAKELSGRFLSWNSEELRAYSQ